MATADAREQYARPITDAARIVRSMLPKHSFDLDELVQIGWEKVLRYPPESGSRTLVFVAAKLAMLNAHNQWIRREWRPNASGNRERTGPAPRLEEFQEWQRCSPTPPIESLIDLRRALSRMRDEEREAWVATQTEGWTLREAGQALACQPHTVLARTRRANERLRRVA